MKKIIYFLSLATITFACSGPKYTASFNSYDVNTGYHTVKTPESSVKTTTATEIKSEQLLASTAATPVEVKKDAVTNTEVRKTYLQMSKTERQALKKHLRSEVRKYVKDHKKNAGVESAHAAKGMDHDLKLAAIFGAVGLVALIISGEVFYIIGGIALIIGVIFFVKWLVRQ